MVGPKLTLAVFSCGSGEDLAGASVDEDLSGMRKERPLLNMVIGDELEGVVLGVDGGFIVNRAIFEGEECFCRNLIAVNDLGAISISNDLAVWRNQFEKAVIGSLDLVNGCGVGMKTRLDGADEQDSQECGQERLQELGSGPELEAMDQ